MKNTIARALVVLKAAPTYLVAASAVVTIFADELATVLPAGAAADVGEVAIRVTAVLAAAVAIIRRVQPVVEQERGLLPNG